MDINKLHNKINTLYKGDVYTASLYLLFGLLAFIGAYFLYLNPISLGFYYLSVSMLIFSIYMIGKGGVMIYFYYSRYKFYKNRTSLSNEILTEEQDYVLLRSNKKRNNRRRYLYLIALAVVIGIIGVFSKERGLLISMAIPVALISTIEFVIGLMTTFRLDILNRDITKVLE